METKTGNSIIGDLRKKAIVETFFETLKNSRKTENITQFLAFECFYRQIHKNSAEKCQHKYAQWRIGKFLCTNPLNAFVYLQASPAVAYQKAHGITAD